MAAGTGARPKLIRSNEGAESRTRGSYDFFDYNLLAAIILLVCFGLVMLYSTSANKTSSFFIKQTVISAGSFAAMLFMVNRFDYHKWSRDYAVPLYGIAFLLMLVTPVIGFEVNGAKRWIKVGPIQFQPSEIAKLAVILFLPAYIESMKEQINTIRGTVVGFIMALVPGLSAYIFTDNLSTGLIIIAIGILMIFIAQKNWKYYIRAAMGGVVLLVFGILFIIPRLTTDTGNFRIGRLAVWLHPEQYASEEGYQITQALYALGSGGLFGKGLGNSVQKLGSLPEAQNDMIFAIICEELGVFGALLVIGLFVFMLYRLYFIARHAPDLLGSLIVSGIFIHIALQVVLNIGVVTNLLPTTGITLPFISYGGTSVVFLIAEMTIALNVSTQIKSV